LVPGKQAAEGNTKPTAASGAEVRNLDHNERIGTTPAITASPYPIIIINAAATTRAEASAIRSTPRVPPPPTIVIAEKHDIHSYLSAVLSLHPGAVPHSQQQPENWQFTHGKPPIHVPDRVDQQKGPDQIDRRHHTITINRGSSHVLCLRM
jgi:hypothetical protein